MVDNEELTAEAPRGLQRGLYSSQQNPAQYTGLYHWCEYHIK